VIVVRDHAVAEAGPFVHDEVVLIAEQPTDRDEYQSREQRDVEDQISGFPAVAFLGRQGQYAAILVPTDDPPAAAQHGSRCRPCIFDGGSSLEATRLRKPFEVFRSRKWLGAHRLGVQANPRYEAADQRNEQEQVDRREPCRAEYVKHAEAIQESPPGAVLGEIRRDLGRIERSLR
jgi:hypothetical protein